MITPSLLAGLQTRGQDMEGFGSHKRGPIQWLDVGRTGRWNDRKLDLKLVRWRGRKEILAGTLKRRPPRIGESTTRWPIPTGLNNAGLDLRC